MDNDACVAIRMPQAVWQAVRRLAALRGMSGATLVRSLVMAELERSGKKEKAS